MTPEREAYARKRIMRLAEKLTALARHPKFNCYHLRKQRVSSSVALARWCNELANAGKEI